MSIVKATPKDFDIIANKFTAICTKEQFTAEVSFAAQLINKNVMLQKTTMQSRLEAVLNVANCGMSLNPVLGWAHLVPRYNSKTRETDCTLVPDYKGLVHVAQMATGLKIWAYNVYEGDEFKETLGTEPKLIHNPIRASKVIEKSYAVAQYPDGSTQFDVMTIDELHKIRAKSESFKAFKAGKLKKEFVVWLDHEGEMCKKTVIKRLCKLLPKAGPDYTKLANAISVDHQEYIPAIDDMKILELTKMLARIPDSMLVANNTSKVEYEEQIQAIQDSGDWELYRQTRKELIIYTEQDKPDFREGTAINKTITATQKAVNEHMEFEDAKIEMKKS